MSKQIENNQMHSVQGFAHQRGRSSSTVLRDVPNTHPRGHISSIKRKAIDLIGRVGHQYDASQDKVIKNIRLLDNLPLKCSTDLLPSCLIIKGEMANNDTLLKILDIDDQSILNLLLNSMSNGTQGILFNSRSSFDHRKRLLFYRRIVEKETLPLQPQWNYFEGNSQATHLITSISFGIELLIILEVPSELSMQDVDEQLYKLSMSFRTGRRLGYQDTLLAYLDQLKITMIYTNISKFVALRNISTIYERLWKFKIRSAQPIFYYLHPLSSVYNHIHIIYRKINYGIIYSVQSELLMLRHLFEDADLLLPTYNHTKIDQQYEELKERYLLLQQTLTLLISDIQQGRKNEYELVDYFIRAHYRNLVNDIQRLIDDIQPLSRSNSSSHSTSSHDSMKINEMNVLLLGETGVGKSTFINALANYMRFESLKDMEENDPIVLIPTSFLVTTRIIKRINSRITDFNEITIRFGEPDSNEQNNDQGQSVTQQCKSYRISINDQTKLNIIDTPGIGDTRGLSQDQLNIEHISSFIQKFHHLKAVCILLKPNIERLHPSFRLYLFQLFQILHPNIRKNIIFCFTNARSTLYMPGNTVLLLEEVLKQLPGDRVVFNHSNTFCFDSESFRFVAAMKQGIQFSEQQDREYQQSWIRSTVESDRFLRYIQSLKSSRIPPTTKLRLHDNDTTSCQF